ncbi:MAG: hypothetical protein DMG80_14005 [Acidobacteria bacterium]|nr:MAG: hypothetical protein DMG80_14005 [Acidobacteriota bacterium]
MKFSLHPFPVTHAKLILLAVAWLRRYRCGVVLSEQACVGGEISRADFLVDREKPFRQKPENGVGCERFYLVPKGLIRVEELRPGWGLLELCGREIEKLKPSAKNLRTPVGFGYEMNLLLASLRRVEVRIEPQSITDFLKWKNRMAEYNRGRLPEGIVPAEDESNLFLEPISGD